MEIKEVCPFCGSKPVLSMVEGDPPDEYPDEYFVECLSCRFFLFENTQDEVIRKWNRRTAPWPRT